jgi:hypothetical protein
MRSSAIIDHRIAINYHQLSIIDHDLLSIHSSYYLTTPTLRGDGRLPMNLFIMLTE